MTVPSALGTFTGQLGTSLSMLGNIALATAGGSPAPIPSLEPDDFLILRWDAPTPVLRWAEDVAAQINWSVFIGRDTVILCPPEVPGGPITGWTIVVTIRDATGASVLTPTVTIVDGPNGVFSFPIARADTLTLPAGQYTYDAARTDSGSYTELLIGQLTLLTPVTT